MRTRIRRLSLNLSGGVKIPHSGRPYHMRFTAPGTSLEGPVVCEPENEKGWYNSFPD